MVLYRYIGEGESSGLRSAGSRLWRDLATLPQIYIRNFLAPVSLWNGNRRLKYGSCGREQTGHHISVTSRECRIVTSQQPPPPPRFLGENLSNSGSRSLLSLLFKSPKRYVYTIDHYSYDKEPLDINNLKRN